MLAFVVLWFGQFISNVGSELTDFALGVWVFQKTGSVTDFALISFSTQIPGILLYPITGAIVDRINRRTAILISDLGSAFCTAALALLLYFNQLEQVHIYLLVGFNAAFNTIRWPALAASMTVLVPKDQIGRSSGLLQLSQATTQIVAPLLAPVLLALVGLSGVIFIDCATFGIAITTALMVRIPSPASPTKERHFLADVAFGWKYLIRHRQLFLLLVYFSVLNLFLGTAQVLLTPLVLKFSDKIVLGRILSTSGACFLCGSLIMSAWGGPKHRVRAVIGLTVIQGIALFVAGLRPNPVTIAAGMGLYMLCLPIILGSSQAVWQTRTAPEVQGRVFAIRRMISWSTLPIAQAMAGPLTDRLLEPAFLPGGVMAQSLGEIWGLGQGRGIGFLFSVAGAASVVLSVFMLSLKPVRELDSLQGEASDAA